MEGISGTGHHSYITSPDNSEIFTIYHTHTLPQKPSGNRQMNIDRVLFTEKDELVINGPTVSWMPAPNNDKHRTLHNGQFSKIEIINLPSEKLAESAEADKLVDSFLAIQPYEDNYQVKINAPEATVKINLDMEHKLAAVVLVAGADNHSNIGALSLEIGDKKAELGEFLATGPESKSFAFTLEPTKTAELSFNFKAKDKNEPMVLSEIYLIENLD